MQMRGWLLDDCEQSEQIILWVTHREFNSLSSLSHLRSLWAQHSQHLKFFRCVQSIDPHTIYPIQNAFLNRSNEGMFV